MLCILTSLPYSYLVVPWILHTSFKYPPMQWCTLAHNHRTTDRGGVKIKKPKRFKKIPSWTIRLQITQTFFRSNLEFLKLRTFGRRLTFKNAFFLYFKKTYIWAKVCDIIWNWDFFVFKVFFILTPSFSMQIISKSLQWPHTIKAMDVCTITKSIL